MRKILLGILILSFSFAGCKMVSSPADSEKNLPAEKLIHHEIVLDSSLKLLPWMNQQTSYGYPFIMSLAWNGLKKVPIQPNGLKTYFSHSMFDGRPGEHLFKGNGWVHNPAGVASMLALSAVDYYGFSGDRSVIDLAQELLDYHLAHGLTEASDQWASVPYASANPGATEYRGADETKFCETKTLCGRGDGRGIIEPDKVGEMGYALIRFYQLTLNKKYLDGALACAEALVKNLRVGSEKSSPWPFRVDAATGTVIVDDYTSNVLGPILLFDELLKIKKGDLAKLQATRDAAWQWLLQYPMQNHRWIGYFEDIPRDDSYENYNQITPLEVARYLMLNPNSTSQALVKAKALIDWVKATFAIDWNGNSGLEKGQQWGADVLSEQIADMAKMGSHTARYGSVLALYAKLTKNPLLMEQAQRSLNWATYACRQDGVVKVGTNDREGYWFTDGYGDYMRHFQAAVVANSQWIAPQENHFLKSTTVLQRIEYFAKKISYQTYDGNATEWFKLSRKPKQILVDGQELTTGIVFENYELKLSHRGNKVEILLD